MRRWQQLAFILGYMMFPLSSEARPPEPGRGTMPTGKSTRGRANQPVSSSSREEVFRALNAPPSERIDDPWMPPPPESAVSSSATSSVSFGPYISVQVNVNALGNNIGGDAANEPSIAINPVNPNQIAIGWRQFDSVTSNFRQAGRAYSSNGGQTWTFPGKLDPGRFRSDPVLGFDAAGNFYYSSLTIPINNPNSFEVHVFKSIDGGVTWLPGVYAFGGDKQWMAVDDRANGSGAGFIYQFWTLPFTCCPGTDFTRSVNGGTSFQTSVALPDPHMMWGTLDTDSNGVLYMGGAALDQSGHLFTRSLDAQNSAVTPTFDAPKAVDLGGFTGGFGGFQGPNPAGLLGQVWLTASPPKPGHVYMLGSVIRASDPTDVMFAASVDGGQTWSLPRRVNDDPEGSNEWQWFGTLSGAPNGRLDAVWNDTRVSHDPAVSAVFYSYSMDEGQTWSANKQVSPTFDSHLGFPNQDKIGDYYHMISDDGGANLAYAATFNGEQDVYFLRIRQDCNDNGIDDDCDIACGPAETRCAVTGCGQGADCNLNRVPDECEPNHDCNNNGVRDICEIGLNPSLDCNSNRLLDSCEDTHDCNKNNIPDICDVFVHGDCNRNRVPDECDVSGGHSADRNHDGIPDECQGSCCDCVGCSMKNENECFAVNAVFGGLGTFCGDADSCEPPVFQNDICAQAEELPSAPQISRPFDNRCATGGEGPPTVPCSGDQPIGTDLWYEYMAPCNGTLHISTCDQTFFDAIMAVYGSGSACACPNTNASMLQCQDDSCGPGGGPPFIDLSVVAGQCYTIRLGGWNGSTGAGELALDYLTPCNPTDLNGDGVTDLRDFARFENCFGPVRVGCAAADFNHDGVVNLRDYRAMFAMFGR